MGGSIKLTLHYKNEGKQPYDSIMTSCSVPTIRGDFRKDLVKTWALGPKTCLGGFHAQQVPNTNIVTRPRFNLLVQRSLHRVPPTLLELLQGRQRTEPLPAGSPVRIVLRPRCQNYFPASMPVSHAFVQACLQLLL